MRPKKVTIISPRTFLHTVEQRVCSREWDGNLDANAQRVTRETYGTIRFADEQNPYCLSTRPAAEDAHS